jgi:hypothetical protein
MGEQEPIDPPLVADPDHVTPAWLTAVLRHAGAIAGDTEVTAFEATQIGTGQVGANVRYVLEYDGAGGPASVVGKFSSRDPDSAAAGIATLTYETEVAFYRQLADTVAISRPHCYYAAIEHGTADVVLVLDDITPAVQGDQIAGCTIEQAELALDEAAKLHGPRWGDPGLADLAWLDRSGTIDASVVLMMWEGFRDRYRSTLSPVSLDEGERLMGALDRWWGSPRERPTVVHTDYRLDNMLFGTGPGARPLTVVDWQTVQLGIGAHDVAYFLGNAFEPEVRRSCEERLVRRYHDALVGLGVDGYSFDRCWHDYMRASHASFLMAVFASMLVGRTPRGDEMFMKMANRSAQMAADLDASSLLLREE